MIGEQSQGLVLGRGYPYGHYLVMGGTTGRIWGDIVFAHVGLPVDEARSVSGKLEPLTLHCGCDIHPWVTSLTGARNVDLL
jgi:hypothetical protein